MGSSGRGEAAEADAAPCGCGARGGCGGVRAVQPAVGVSGEGASCRPSPGGRVRKGVDVPGVGPSAGGGTCGERVALPVG